MSVAASFARNLDCNTLDWLLCRQKPLFPLHDLHTIVHNQSAYKEWYDKLSAVAGVYLITDKRTGKHYVGSASGEQGGIWGRWSEYARTKHGGNKRLIELINADPEYCHNFQYSILEVFPIKKDRQEVLECERLPCQRSHHSGRA